MSKHERIVGVYVAIAVEMAHRDYGILYRQCSSVPYPTDFWSAYDEDFPRTSDIRALAGQWQNQLY